MNEASENIIIKYYRILFKIFDIYFSVFFKCFMFNLTFVYILCRSITPKYDIFGLHGYPQPCARDYNNSIGTIFYCTIYKRESSIKCTSFMLRHIIGMRFCVASDLIRIFATLRILTKAAEA